MTRSSGRPIPDCDDRHTLARARRTALDALQGGLGPGLGPHIPSLVAGVATRGL